MTFILCTRCHQIDCNCNDRFLPSSEPYLPLQEPVTEYVLKKPVNREQRRYECARDFMAAMLAAGVDRFPNAKASISASIEWADALLNELEKTK